MIDGAATIHADRDGDGQHQTPDDGLPRKLVGAALIAGADRLGDEHRRADIDGREDRDDEEDDLEAGADPGHGRGAEARHHEGVDGADQRLQQVLADDRGRQREHPPLRHGLRGSGCGGRGELREKTRSRGLFGRFERFVDCGLHAPPKAPKQDRSGTTTEDT